MAEYIFFWNIENYSYCWHKNGEILASPEFTSEGLEGTVWTLELFPRGEDKESEGSISLFLTRSKDDNGPTKFLLNYELSFLKEDGSTLCVETDEFNFKTANGRGNAKFVGMDEVLDGRKCDYLPHDTLIVRCKMWWGEGSIPKIGQSSARTRIAVKKISFLHLVKNFSTLKLNQSDTFEIGSHTKDNIISSRLYCSDCSCCEERIIVEIKSSKMKFISKCKLSLLDGFGNVIDCGPVNNCIGVVQNDFVKLFLALTKQVIMDKKTKYLTDDKLSLIWECTFSTGIELNCIEEIVYEIPSVACKIERNVPTVGKLIESFNALDDFKSIYTNQVMTDVELNTNTASFYAHKIVLCARSLVFKAMLSNDMKEKNCDCIKIEDLEDETLNQLLLFLYCDEIENLLWETATKLYYAADKYEINKLKVVCSQFLKDNLTAGTASKLLLLADTHNDSDLKQVVEDFILQHDVLVFGTAEWENLIETNPLLALKTMHLKYRTKM